VVHNPYSVILCFSGFVAANAFKWNMQKLACNVKDVLIY